MWPTEQAVKKDYNLMSPRSPMASPRSVPFKLCSFEKSRISAYHKFSKFSKTHFFKETNHFLTESFLLNQRTRPAMTLALPSLLSRANSDGGGEGGWSGFSSPSSSSVFPQVDSEYLSLYFKHRFPLIISFGSCFICHQVPRLFMES